MQKKIYLGNNSVLELKGTGNVKVDNGIFKNVNLVPDLVTNFLFYLKLQVKDMK